MNVIHGLAWYFPESVGGTEIYVSGLVRELAAYGIESRIAAAVTGMQSADYVQDGVGVHRYPFSDEADLAATRGERPYRNFGAFTAWLERQPRGIYHQHSWTTSCGLRHIEAAKALGFKTVLTVHVPAYICLRGTMMEFGSEPCDGRVEAVRCAACWSQGRGVSRAAAHVFSRVPRIVSVAAYGSDAENRLVTALGSRELAATRQRQIAGMAAAADRVVAVCNWLADALRKNGIADDKLVASRQGVDCSFVPQARSGTTGADKFRLGFVGRCDPVKGLPFLLAVVARLPRDLPLEVIVHAVANSEEECRLRDSLMVETAADPRIKFLPPVLHRELPAVLAEFHMLAVPSQWLETGPLVVLEAQACGVPVLGSDLGGIAELVTPGLDGELVPFSDQEAWAEAIWAAVAGNLPSLECRIPRSVRTMADAARDMASLYAGLA
ncbi:MAG: glycosyltransferase [Xanthobacteraceae bacterium]